MLIIDRFEGEYAVVEQDGAPVQILRRELPAHAREGDCVVLENGQYKIDRIETEKRREEIRNLQKSLWE